LKFLACLCLHFKWIRK